MNPINWLKINITEDKIALILISPLLLGFLSAYILNPLIGYFSPRIEYGEVDLIPIQYIDKWTNDYNLNDKVELSIKQTLIELNIYDETSESSYSYACQPSGVKIDYSYDRARDKYGAFIAYTLLLFPSSIFGNQTVYVKCGSNKEIEYWSFSDPFTDIYQDCIKHRIKFVDGDYLISTTCKYFKE